MTCKYTASAINCNNYLLHLFEAWFVFDVKTNFFVSPFCFECILFFVFSVAFVVLTDLISSITIVKVVYQLDSLRKERTIFILQ